MRGESGHKNNIPNEIWVYKCADRNEIQNYLGFRHVSGVKQWPLISKARYLYDLFQKKNRFEYEVYKEIARETGSRQLCKKTCKWLSSFSKYKS